MGPFSECRDVILLEAIGERWPRSRSGGNLVPGILLMALRLGPRGGDLPTVSMDLVALDWVKKIRIECVKRTGKARRSMCIYKRR